MAVAASLIPGFKYRILKGPFADEVVTIVDNNIIKAEDDPENQRKILVAGPHGEQMYILPRLLSDTPEGFSAAPAQVITVPTVTTLPEYEPSVAATQAAFARRRLEAALSSRSARRAPALVARIAE